MGPVPIWKPVVFQFIMIGMTALMTVLEAAAEAISCNRFERLAGEDDVRAIKLLPRVAKVEGMLPAIQLGTWAVIFLAGFLAAVGFVQPIYEAIPSPLVGNLAMTGIIATICCLTQILGVRLPRRLAARKPDQLALSMFGAVELAGSLLLLPFRMNAVAVRGILGLMRIDISETTEKITEDEIMAMVDRGEEKGAIETNEKEMIENIFEFNNKTAEECMTHRTGMTAIQADATEEEVIALIEETGLSRFPVYGRDIDDILGILTTRRYLLSARTGNPQSVRELIRPAYFVPESARTDVLFREMQTRKTHMAIVVDEYGGTSGLVTMEDLLEEIVGNIYDEFDPQAEQDLIPQEDGSWKAAGSVEMERLCEAMGIDALDEEEFDTLGGLVFSQLTEIPEDGSHPEVECFGLHIRVDELSDRRVEWATVVKAPERSEEEG